MGREMTGPTYYILKLEKCPACKGKGVYWDGELFSATLCSNSVHGRGPCDNGYIETRADLLKVLSKVRWIANDEGQIVACLEDDLPPIVIEDTFIKSRVKA